ncbi:hypothetical protein FACS1894216_15840 [Synergistales bacterium]|nr:hypothetical protein FACS1894216_15840 [Synergistales bacterium]
MLTPGMVGLWILSGYYITGYMLQKPVVARTIVIVLFAVSALIYVPSRYHSLDNYEQRSANLHDITNFLEAEGLTFGYAGFWNANINTVLSDYKVEIAQVYAGGGKLNPQKWLASTHYFEPDYHSGETFVMLTRDEYAQSGADLVGYGTPKKILEHGNYIISVYDYNISINDFNGRLYDDSSDLPDNGITENFPYTAGVALQCGVLNDTDGSFETDGTNGCVMFGPYAPVKTGIYNFILHYEVLNNPNGDEVVGVFDVAQNPGVNIVGQVNISAVGNAVKIENLSFSDAAENFEHRVTISNGAVIRIYKIDIEKVGEELKQTEYGRYIISLAEGKV